MEFYFATNDDKILIQAINDFEEKYHKGFDTIRHLAEQFYQSKSKEQIPFLSSELQRILKEWKAGMRNAPKLMNNKQFNDALSNDDFIESLISLSQIADYLDMQNNQKIMYSNHIFSSVNDFEKCLCDTLKYIANHFFDYSENINITVVYPQKVLLLLTGLMPAIDVNVREGIARSGKGNYSNLYLTDSRHLEKICELAFLISHLRHNQVEFIDNVISHSRYRNCIKPNNCLNNQYGRFFDIIFFMQGKDNQYSNLIKYKP